MRIDATSGEHAGRILVALSGRHVDPAAIAPYLAKVEADIGRYLEFIRTDVDSWHQELTARLAYTVGERAAFLVELAGVAAALP